MHVRAAYLSFGAKVTNFPVHPDAPRFSPKKGARHSSGWPSILVIMMQRLFSAFPGALPGIGLLLLRLAAALSLTALGLSMNDTWPGAVFSILAATVACCLVIGYCTPIAAAIQAGSHLWVLVYSESICATRLVMIGLGISLLLLGPGAWSVDARLYGRRRVDLTTRR